MTVDSSKKGRQHSKENLTDKFRTPLRRLQRLDAILAEPPFSLSQSRRRKMRLCLQGDSDSVANKNVSENQNIIYDSFKM